MGGEKSDVDSGLSDMEGRPPWPRANQRSTVEFLEVLSKSAAPAGTLIAVLTGHTHQDLVCERHGPLGNCSQIGWSTGAALEYTTGANAFGAYRLVEIDT